LTPAPTTTGTLQVSVSPTLIDGATAVAVAPVTVKAPGAVSLKPLPTTQVNGAAVFE
jgi:hypothetical protein